MHNEFYIGYYNTITVSYMNMNNGFHRDKNHVC